MKLFGAIQSGNSILTIGLVYQSANINETKRITQNTKRYKEEVSKGECIIMFLTMDTYNGNI